MLTGVVGQAVYRYFNMQGFGWEGKGGQKSTVCIVHCKEGKPYGGPSWPRCHSAEEPACCAADVELSAAARDAIHAAARHCMVDLVNLIVW